MSTEAERRAQDVLFAYVASEFGKYADLFEHGHPDRAMNRIIADLQVQGVHTTKLELVGALTRLHRSACLERPLEAPKYLMPFTTRCECAFMDMWYMFIVSH